MKYRNTYEKILNSTNFYKFLNCVRSYELHINCHCGVGREKDDVSHLVTEKYIYYYSNYYLITNVDLLLSDFLVLM